jgi:hypothetical protein
MMTTERSKDMQWFYFSFADDDGFLGGLYIDGVDLEHALRRSHELGQNPGGEVKTLEITTKDVELNVPAGDRRHLLSLADLGPTVVWLEAHENRHDGG